jgi:hypothetical protein
LEKNKDWDADVDSMKLNFEEELMKFVAPSTSTAREYFDGLMHT